MPEDIKLPDIGDFTDVEIVEVHIKVGTVLQREDPIVTLETDKASMEIPAEQAGTVTAVHVKTGDTVSEGARLISLQAAEADQPEPPPSEPPPTTEAGTTATDLAPVSRVDSDINTQVVVLGSGPGGYTAAFRAADLGKDTVLIEHHAALGGVCLNVGCIPSKALLHAAKVISEAKEAADFGIDFDSPSIDRTKLKAWKDKVLGQLSKGLTALAGQRKITVLQGTGRFSAGNQITLTTPEGEKTVGFEQAIIAAGSRVATLPELPDDPRIMDSTSALELQDIPKRLLVIGGGIIGLEMATVYHELGSRITVVEMLDRLIPGADADIVQPLHKRLQKQYENIYLGTAVTAIKTDKKGLTVSFNGDKAPAEDTFDRILVAIGRRPNGDRINAEAAGVQVTEQGFIPVDKQQRSNVPHIFAVGDITGEPMLAHKAVHEGKVAAEVAAGLKSAFDARVIPSVAYTDPEVAWVGLTETEAKAQGLDYGKGVFPWAASGRSLTLGRNEGITRLLFDKQTGQVIGAGIVGPNAGDLIAEVALTIEMGCDAEDIALTVHPHPTLSETIAMSAEMFQGTITDLYVPKKK
ncbi:MAG: dihydrolipoyl dehydrogenase [Gammaproteobacteria bacterium]